MEEKQQRLFAAAHELFLTQGFKATSIADIAAQANVAVGTFYNFYPSKSAIFVAIYTQENERVKREILNHVDLKAAPEAVIHQVLHQIFTQSKDNRILQEWFHNAQLNTLIAQKGQATLNDSVVYATLMTLIADWRQRDLLAPGISEDRIISLFNALTIMDIHQSEIQTADYLQLLNDLIAGILRVILK